MASVIEENVSLVRAELIAVLVALGPEGPEVLTLKDGCMLPSGPLQTQHRSLQRGMRDWVERQTGVRPGHIEQLYTFADRLISDDGMRGVAVSYLALTPYASVGAEDVGWHRWYEYFPWEERRSPTAVRYAEHLRDALREWIGTQPPARQALLLHRLALTFGAEDYEWQDELVLQRYEFLYEAGLVAEAIEKKCGVSDQEEAGAGRRMADDHRRILATAMGRLRAKIRYRPVIYEMMPELFTLGELQDAVEHVAGCLVHKQNFRRQVMQQALIEEAGGERRSAGGRPARLYRFRRSLMLDAQIAGSKLPVVRGR
ncbi:MAG: hypothetical protein LKH33_01105 [Acetobacter sp.]|jgi:hypothetical protein|nr:hypothetical protein [Acetobacter sp.]MCH4062349.1 hypothetical protein [Acetobacter sp.]MCH4088804.1 hypothetical protein [Acetobacter sp.]MCI1292709.1 hypothetical protein [Acetobacter sp.]MCI1319191.1 hypothetical protein [Acetobacter sp.]